MYIFRPQEQEHYQINDLPWNDLIDYVMPTLKPNSWKVLCFILRKTLGWNKVSDRLSYSQISGGITTKNASDQTISNALSELVEKGLIIAKNEAGKEKTTLTYELNLNFCVETATKIVADDHKPATKTVVDSSTKIVADRLSATEIVAVNGQTATKIVDTKDVVLPVIDFGEIIERWTDNLGDLGQREAEMLSDYYDDNPQWLSMAIDETIVAKPTKPFPYFRKIINSWIKAGGPVEKEPSTPIPKNGPTRQPKLSAPIDLERLKKLQQEEL